MAYIRAKKSHRKRRANTTKPVVKRKKKEGRHKLLAQGMLRPVLEKAWDKNKTLVENFRGMGLALNPNSAVPFLRPAKDVKTDDDTMEVEKVSTPSSVVTELEEVAACGVKHERHIAPGEVEFVTYMTNKHGADYKAMARDKRNVYQHTPKQLKRKIETFLRSMESQ